MERYPLRCHDDRWELMPRHRSISTEDTKEKLGSSVCLVSYSH